MDRYTLVQRVEIGKTHYINDENITQTLRKVRTAFGYYQVSPPMHRTGYRYEDSNSYSSGKVS